MTAHFKILNLFFTMALLGTCSTHSKTPCLADEISVIVPAYANPCCASGPTMWTQLIATANKPARNFELFVIFNPASGPGTEREANYLNNAGEGLLASVRNAGAIVVGYVSTEFGRRDMSLVKSDIDKYLVDTSFYGGFVDGIFIDEMSNDLANVGYYQEIAAHIEMRSAGAPTFGNPGIYSVYNPSGQTEFSSSDFVAVFDTVATFENTGDKYRTDYTAPEYLVGQPVNRFAHLVHTEMTWDSSTLNLTAIRRAGFLYVTDEAFSTNPWDNLATYWSDFTADVIAYNRGVAGDLDADGDIDSDDIDSFSGNLGQPASFNANLDRDEDGTITLADRDQYVTTLVPTSNGETGALLGDINLDGTVDVLGDAVVLVANLGREGTFGHTEGDLNGDGKVDILGDAIRLITDLGKSNR